MATSGSVITGSYDNSYFYVNWQQSSQSVSGNYTDINWQAGIVSGAYWYSNAVRLNAVYINGTKVTDGGTYSNIYKETRQLASGSIRIYHNNDGSKTFNINFSGWLYSDGNLSGSQNFTLNKIARYATMTSATNFNDEENPSFVFSNPANSTMSCWIEPNPTGTHYATRTLSGSSGTFTWDLTEEERNQLRNECTTSNSCTCRIGLYSTIGGTTQASYKDVTMTIVNANPIFTNCDYEDINTTTVNLTKDNKACVTGYSTIKVTISEANKAVAQKGAEIVKYRTKIGTKQMEVAYSDDSDVYMTIIGANSGSFDIYAIDTRGNSTLVSKVASQEIQYVPVYINRTTSKVERNDSGIGENAILNYSGTIWNNTFGTAQNAVTNSIKLTKYEYKATDSSTWITPSSPTDITPTLSGNDFNFNDLVRSNEQDYTFELQKNYDFRITLQDELSTTVVQLTPMPSGIPNISYADDGVGIMCDYDENLGGPLQVEGRIVDGLTRFPTTTPKVLGKWIDGKDLYGVLIQETVANNTTLNNPVSTYGIPSNFDTIFVDNGNSFRTINNKDSAPANYGLGNLSTNVSIGQQGQFTIKNSTGFTFDFYVFVYFTKGS